MNSSYLYDFNKKKYGYVNTIQKKEVLDVQRITNGYIIPTIPSEKYLFGCGGVLDENVNFVSLSGMYSRGNFVEYDKENFETYMGEGYFINPEVVDFCDDVVIYCGYINNHWGHFLIDFSTRLWYCINKDQSSKMIFIVDKDKDFDLIPNIKRFMELLNIDEKRIVFLNKARKFREIIIPESSYMTNSYYSDLYSQMFEIVCDNVLKKAQIKKEVNTYFTRINFAKATHSEIGEEVFIDFFKENDYEIISPEKLTLDQQIIQIRKSKKIACITGTIAHNMLFAEPSQELIILNKTYNFNVMQRDINFIKKLNVVYIDVYLSLFPVTIGKGPFFMFFNSMAKKYAVDNHMKFEISEKLSNKFIRKNLLKYKKLSRRNVVKNKVICYIDDESFSGYFDPKNIQMLYSNFYFQYDRITLVEKITLYFENKAKYLKKKFVR